VVKWFQCLCLGYLCWYPGGIGVWYLDAVDRHGRDANALDPQPFAVAPRYLCVKSSSDCSDLEIHGHAEGPQVPMDQTTNPNFGTRVVKLLDIFLKPQDHRQSRSNGINAKLVDQGREEQVQ
jgi:hypothetical protein